MAQSTLTTEVKGLKGGGLGRTFQKRVNRTREKMMQSIGRKDKTSDGDFDQLAAVFNEQQSVAVRLNSEYKNYIKQVRALMGASESMQLAIRGAYESQWSDSNMYYEFGEKFKENWFNYIRQLEESQAHISGYVDRFDDLKQRIAKRSRKKTDYDSARHNLESLEAAKKRDTFKVTKAQSDMELAKEVYNTLNYDLQMQLKEFYESRVPSICQYLSSMFEAEAIFLNEASKMKHQLACAAKSVIETRPQSFGSYSNNSRSSFNKTNSTYSADGAPIDNKDSPTIRMQRMLAKRSVSNDYEAVVNGESSYSREQPLGEDPAQLEMNYEVLQVTDPAVQVAVSSDEIEMGHHHHQQQQQPQQQHLTENPIQVAVNDEEFIIVDPTHLKENNQRGASSSSIQPLPTNTSLCSSSSSSGLVSDTLVLTKVAEWRPASAIDPSTADRRIEIDKIEITPPKLIIDSKQRYAVESILKLSGGGQVENIATTHVEVNDVNLELNHHNHHQKRIDVVTASNSRVERETTLEEATNSLGESYNMHVKYQVVALYDYNAGDEDELSFKAGEIINITDFENPDEMDDGWLTGFKVLTGEKGILPENFTKRYEQS